MCFLTSLRLKRKLDTRAPFTFETWMGIYIPKYKKAWYCSIIGEIRARTRSYQFLQGEIIQILHPYKKELPRARARTVQRINFRPPFDPQKIETLRPILRLKKSFDAAARTRTNAPKPWYYWVCKKEIKNFYQFLYLFWPKKRKSKLKTAFFMVIRNSRTCS